MREPADPLRRRLIGAAAVAVAGMPLRVLSQPGTMPSFAGASAWLNSPPLTLDALRGKAVLVDFCTYTCIYWRRTLPYVRAWAAKYKDAGLVVVGVHTPEFGFEKERANVERQVKNMSIDYPVALDNDYAIWRAFGNEYWPALYFVDARGRIRDPWFGEGGYERSERMIQRLLAETGIADMPRDLVAIEGRGVEAPADAANLRSPETYLGYARTGNFMSTGTARDKPHPYALPGRLPLNGWALGGDWTIASGDIVSNQAGARIAYRFHARDLHLVMSPMGGDARPIRFRVTLDGKPPAASHGIDIGEDGTGRLIEPRMYQLVRQPAPIAERQFEIEFLDAGAQAYTFTFG